MRWPIYLQNIYKKKKKKMLNWCTHLLIAWMSLKHFPNFLQHLYLVFLSASFFIIFENVVSDVILWVDKQLLGLALLIPPLHPHDKEQHQHCRTNVSWCYSGYAYTCISTAARVQIQQYLHNFQQEAMWKLSCHHEQHFIVKPMTTAGWSWQAFIGNHIKDS